MMAECTAHAKLSLSMLSDIRSSNYKPKVRGSEGLGLRLGIGTSEGSATFNKLLLHKVYVALYPGPPFNFARGEPGS